MPKEKFSIIYADPPWRYEQKNRQGSAELHYPTMSIEEICSLPVADLAAKDSVLFLWATFPQLPEALKVIKAWGFSYRSVAFVWIKRNRRSYSWFYGLGYWTRGNAEICLLAVKGHMNGQLDESGTPKNLPNAESINALGIGYGSNITIRNITFRDCYNGHVIQVAGSDNVLIENCRFEGQSFRGSGDKTRELLQIEPGTVKGYPYTLVQNKAPSTNVTIRNCYFGGSENTPHYMAAIGTHSQQAGVKCSDIVIEDCTFDNAAYTAIHFMAYDRITIRNNIFTITSDSEQIDRYGILADTYGSFIDPTGAESTTDFTIEGNTFDVSDPKATVLEITTNNKSPKHIKNVTIKDNTLKGVNGGKAIDLYLLDNCTISGNTIEGFERPIVANSCDEQFISDTDIVTE